jgi:hypothetical protein
MAENLRDTNTREGEVERRRLSEIAVEALRQMENCLYTSTMLYMWLRRVRLQSKLVTLAPILLTALAGFGYLKELLPAWAVALIALLATLIPSLAKALDIQTHVQALQAAASEYKSLQDRFRRLARITALSDADRAEDELTQLMDRMDTVRATSITPPERYFQRAQTKIKRGDYDFTIDLSLREALSGGSVTPLPPPA